MNSLAFFKPEFFWALLFIPVIILLHLLKRPRSHQLELSTLRFFHSAAVTSNKYNNLRKLLLLALRILMVIIIVTLFARPFNPTNAISLLGNPQVSVYVWIDNTYSMSYKTDNRSLSKQAYSLVDSLHNVLPSSGKMYLFDHDVNEFRASNQQNSDHPGKIDIQSAIDKFNNSKDKNSNAILVICSDFQSISCTSIDSALRSANFRNPILLVSFTPESPWNYTVDNAHFTEQTVQARVTAQGKFLKSAKVSVHANNMNYGGSILSLKKNSCDSITVETSISKSSSGTVNLEVDDPMQFDNVDYFSPDDRNGLIITIVGNKQKNFVIGAALKASGSTQWKSVLLRDETEVTFDELDSSDLVIINALHGSSRALDAFVATRGSAGKSIVLCIEASDSSITWYKGLLARAFPSQSHNIDLKNIQVYPVLPDTVSDVWRKFPELKIDEAIIRKYISGFSGDVFLKFNNGDPFIWSAIDSTGKTWILFSTALGLTEENNLYQTGFFVPLLDRLSHFLVSKSRTSAATWHVSELHQNPYFKAKYKVNVFDYQGKFINNIAGQQYISFIEPGIYKIFSEDKLPTYIKVRPDSLESLIQYSIPEICKRKDIAVSLVDKNSLIKCAGDRSEMLAGILPWLILIGIIISEVILWRQSPKKVT